MIPKIIHYCWFGKKEKPKSVLKYIKSWKDHLPDYEIKEWNESNFDVNMIAYTKEAYYAKKYAFVSDVVRLYALVQEGGIYLDTDILFLRPLESYFLEEKAIFGIESKVFLSTSFMASERNGKMVSDFLQLYKDLHFFESFKYNQTTNVVRITDYLRSKNILLNNSYIRTIDYVIYPQEFFNAKSFESGEYLITQDTYCVHDFASMWVDKNNNLFEKIKVRFNMFLTISRYIISQ